MRSFYN